MPSRNGNVHGGQVSSQSVPGVSTQEVSTDGNEQGRSVNGSVLFIVLWRGQRVCGVLIYAYSDSGPKPGLHRGLRFRLHTPGGQCL